jgi:hypothetical protein
VGGLSGSSGERPAFSRSSHRARNRSASRRASRAWRMPSAMRPGSRKRDPQHAGPRRSSPMWRRQGLVGGDEARGAVEVEMASLWPMGSTAAERRCARRLQSREVSAGSSGNRARQVPADLGEFALDGVVGSHSAAGGIRPWWVLGDRAVGLPEDAAVLVNRVRKRRAPPGAPREREARRQRAGPRLGASPLNGGPRWAPGTPEVPTAAGSGSVSCTLSICGTSRGRRRGKSTSFRSNFREERPQRGW